MLSLAEAGRTRVTALPATGLLELRDAVLAIPPAAVDCPEAPDCSCPGQQRHTLPTCGGPQRRCSSVASAISLQAIADSFGGLLRTRSSVHGKQCS